MSSRVQGGDREVWGGSTKSQMALHLYRIYEVATKQLEWIENVKVISIIISFFLLFLENLHKLSQSLLLSNTKLFILPISCRLWCLPKDLERNNGEDYDENSEFIQLRGFRIHFLSFIEDRLTVLIATSMQQIILVSSVNGFVVILLTKLNWQQQLFWQ